MVSYLIPIKHTTGILRSIHTNHIEDVHEMPFHLITRAAPSELDEAKVLSLMETLKASLSFNYTEIIYFVD